MGLKTDVQKAFAREEGSALLPAAFLAFGLLDAVPIPTDIGYFYTEKWLQEHKDELSSREFWLAQYLNYYGWDVAWYLSLFAVTYYGGRTVSKRMQLGVGMITTGALVTVLWRFSQAAKNARKKLPPGK